MHDCASILDSIAKGIPCFHDFSHGASLHPYSFNGMIFCTYFSWFAYGSRINTATHMHTCVALRRYFSKMESK